MLHLQCNVWLMEGEKNCDEFIEYVNLQSLLHVFFIGWENLFMFAILLMNHC